MNKIIRNLSFIILLTAFHLSGFAQIKIVDDDYQPELGGLEELKLEDLDPKMDFKFAIGDSVYVLESTHKFLCFNKNTHKASIKPFKTGYYVVTGICFGDSLDHLHSLVDQYSFDKEYDRQEAHAIIYGMRIECTSRGGGY